MEKNPQFLEQLNQAKVLFDQGKNSAFIEGKLKEKNIQPEHLAEILKLIKHIDHSERNKKGAQLIIFGVILLGAGFVTSIVMHLNGSNSLDFPLYGLTAAGIIVLIAGLIYLFH